MPTLTNRWAVLALLFFARLSIPVQFQSIPPLVTFLVEDWGVTSTQVGVLIGLYMAPGVLLSLPGGLLGNRFGDKPILVASLALMVLGAVVFAHSPSYEVAYAG
ncbi:MAG: MFS transporter, partial [SAR324 cluster bacterium]|nr:MFS transporter [SAR324 cluster bacterium]